MSALLSSAVRVGLALLLTLGSSLVLAARHALVVGNDSYRHVTPLENARNDAKAMAAALRQVGYTVDLRLDLGLRDMQAALRELKARVTADDEVVVYFSGHGVQIDSANYLLPVDMRLPDKGEEVRDEAVALQRLLDDLAERKARFSLLIIDACRNNPFKTRGRSLGGAGLAQTAAATGQMVVYSAGTDQQALDRLSNRDPVRNGVFTRVFVREMMVPGRTVSQVMKTVQRKVFDLAATVNHTQTPALYDQSLGDFYFIAPTGPQAGAAPSGDLAAELAMWSSVRGARDANGFLAYLNAYPAGQFTELARLRLRELGHTGSGDGAGSGRAPGSTFRDCPECPELVVLPAGRLMLASESDSANAQKSVDIAVPFAVGRFEVTFDEWDACVSGGGCTAGTSDEGWGRGNRPVVNVSWPEALAYVRWLSQKTGAKYRLLRDAEWQYAASGGARALYPWGNSVESGLANCTGCGAPEFERRRTAPVGSFAPNGMGLHDVVGNVWEWVEDCYSSTLQPVSAAGPRSCASHLTRGGSFRTLATDATLTHRRETAASQRSPQIGFRVAREL